jgi:hypothetical protein
VVLHHGGGSDYAPGRLPYSIDGEKTQLRSWENYHLSKGWRGLAYGWGLGQTGTVYRIRGWNRYGAHLGDVDGDGIANNDELIPIIWIASGHHHDMSSAAQTSLARLRAEIIQPRAPAAVWLYGHQEVQPSPTLCPGPRGMNYVESNRLLEDDNMPTAEEIAAAVWAYKLDHFNDPEDLAAGRQLNETHFHARRARQQTTQAKIVAAVQSAGLSGADAEAVADELARRLVE